MNKQTIVRYLSPEVPKEEERDARARFDAPRVVEVSPEKAKRWLGKMRDQRTVSWATVSAYARDMRAGKWFLNHQGGIAFDGEGFLVDGQHRLNAVVEADMSIPFLVFKNCEYGTRSEPIDVGRARASYFIAGLKSTTHAAALAELYRLCTTEAVHKQTAAILEDASRLVTDEAFLHELLSSKGKNQHIKSGFIAACLYAHPIAPEKVEEFARLVRDGEMLKRGMPAYAYRGWSDGMIGHGAKPQVLSKAALNAVYHHCIGQQLNSIHTGETGYRKITMKRRAMKVPNTPSPELVSTDNGRGDEK